MKKPKAIFICGASGSGKTYLSNVFNKYNFNKINLDDSYETELQKKGLGTKINTFDSEKLSLAAKIMADTRKNIDKLFEDLISKRKNIIIDTVGASSSSILDKNKKLKLLDYDTLMIMVYASPITSIERNIMRNRTLSADMVLRTWRDVYANIKTYMNEFFPNFLFVNNENKSSKIPFNYEYIKKTYIDPYKVKTKPKTQEYIQKSIDKKHQINIDIENILKKPKNFDSLETFQKKLLNFINNNG